MIRKNIILFTLLFVFGCSSSNLKNSYISGKEIEVKILETKITDNNGYVVLSEEVCPYRQKDRYLNIIFPIYDNRCYRKHLPRTNEIWCVALDRKNEKIIEFVYISE